MSQGLFEERSGIPWISERTGADCLVYTGQGGGSELEVVITDSEGRPTKQFLRNTYTDRKDGRVSPILVVARYSDGVVGLCGPTGEEPNVYRDIDEGQARRVCDAALDKPDHHAARRFLTDTIPQLEEDLTGVHNQGLLSTHELKVGVPKRDDWQEAAERAVDAFADDPRELLRGLDYEIERINDQSHVLKHAEEGRESAVAVFLEEEESFEHKQDRFVGDSPVAFALRQAEEKNLDYVIGSSGDQLRLYTTNPEAGFGSRGQTDTYVEVNTRLLDDEQAAYLWLLFSADALQDDGSLHQIMEDSKEYATGLGERLRERIYDGVVPQLAEAIADARDLTNPSKDELDETYRMTLVLLYRLLFVAYAEDERFLPRHRNPQYDKYSIKQKARDIHDGLEFDENQSFLWNEVMTLTGAIHEGSSSMGLPAYDGRLLSEDPEWTEAGAALAEIELSDAEFGPALEELLIDETPDGWRGPVDFRNIGVREFGVIYEGLLESELSVADQDLATEVDDGDEQYVPAEEDDEVVIEEGEVYLHGQSGERKATGTYYTKTRFVEHLLDYSLEPALEEHLERVDRILEGEGDAAAADAFFDFRTADIAMGSGHFLVGAVDRIEKRFRNYLQDQTITGVEEELDNLKDAALAAFEEDEHYTPDIERSQLLRRQIARRCIYGVDLNPLATELARLSLWVHTFVPGLPLTFLDYNLTTGDSLAGIGTLDEVTEIIDVEQAALSDFLGGGSSVMKEIKEDIEELGNFADTSAEHVAEARETRQKLDERLEPVRARFDILAASRIDDEVNTATVSDSGIEDVTGLSSYEKAQKALESTRPVHFPAAFPEVFMDDGGFDVIVGNPPWEKTQIEEHEFWARHHPGLRALSQGERERIITDLKQERPDLLREFNRQKEIEEKRGKLLVNGPYPDIGKTHPDLYKAFVWRFWDLNKTNGHTGVVLPRATFITPSMEQYRRTILESGSITDLTFVINTRNWVFSEVHPQFTIALASIQKSEPSTDSTIPLRGPYPDEESFEEGIHRDPHRFDLESAQSWGGSAKFPLLPPSPVSVDAFNQLDDSGRVDSGEEWNAVPYQELNATQDKERDDGTKVIHVTDDQPEDYWPVYKGESYHLWNPDTGTYFGWADPDVVTEYLQEARESSYQYAGRRSAFSDMPEEWVNDPTTLPCLSARIAFRDVARHNDSRTVIPALIPPKRPVVHNSPTLVWPKGDEFDEAYLLGVLCSLPLDWYARRFVENHVTFGIFNNLPVPRPGRTNRLRQRVVELAGRLAAVDERYSDWADTVGVDYGPLDKDDRQDRIYELDAVVTHLYGLTREHVEVIFETFHDNWDHEQRLEQVLDYYADWADRLDLDHAGREEERAASMREDE